MNKLALLILKDGTKFYGNSIGSEGISIGEVVFNTSLTGYQEILTDPSYSNQIVILTNPHIGNVGTNKLDNESSKIQVKGLIIKDLSIISSNFRNKLSLSNFLKKQNIIGISNIDTRKLTRLIRNKGVQNGCIMTNSNINIKSALNLLNNFDNLNKIDLIKNVSTKKKYIWNKGSIKLIKKIKKIKKKKYHVIAYDFGIKYNIMRMLVDRNCKVTVVPAKTSINDILKMKPNGIFLSNGPGDPSNCKFAINSIKKILKKNIPLFGICLGYQLLALSLGAKTIKMKFGHHGSNHPVKDLKNDKVIITSQNHNFTVDNKNLPKKIKITHISLFDGTLQGIHHKKKPAFGFQGHPEASPGPHDASSLFDYFIHLINLYKYNMN